MAAAKEISTDAEVAVLSELDFIFKLKEEQKPTLKAFPVGQHCFYSVKHCRE